MLKLHSVNTSSRFGFDRAPAKKTTRQNIQQKIVILRQNLNEEAFMMNTLPKYIIKKLAGWIGCPFKLITDGKEEIVGDGEPQFTVSVNGPIDLGAFMNSATLALGEAYMKGDIDVKEDLYEALDCLMQHLDDFDRNDSALTSIIKSVYTKKHQKEDVCSHYDIGNDFYSLWLDESLSYSCACFKDENDTLFEAQMNKIDRILDKLFIKEGDALLDIGCGWGHLMLRAAKRRGAHGLGITLSEEQCAKFDSRIDEEGLRDKVAVKLMDYRDLPKLGEKFDKVASVGMMEHVGRENYGTYFDSVQSVMKKGGLFLLHSITAHAESDGDPWIKKYIFPGGMLPSLRELISNAAERSFFTLDVESLRRHYVRTLKEWRKAYLLHKDDVEKKFGTEFVRMWDLYLAACAASFHRGNVDIHQILLSNGVNNDIPMLRRS
jgi:cyclopropane-fatty-acyl-phospholipid synthase